MERAGDGPPGGTTGKLSVVPPTQPLSVTGPASVAGRPTLRAICCRWLSRALVLAILSPPCLAQSQGGRSLPPPQGASLPAAAPVPQAEMPLSDRQVRDLLRTADLDQLEPLCARFLAEGNLGRVRLVGQRLLTVLPAPQPLEVVLANAEVLLRCRLPTAALTVLDRISPDRGAERVQWLMLQWRAAEAALDPRRAALALERLAAGNPARLASLMLPVRQRDDGSWVSRPALDLLVADLEAAGRPDEAASLLLSSGRDALAAERLDQALHLWASLPETVREPLMEQALEQAAAAGSWGLVSDLLAAQAASATSPEALARNRERRMRLSRRLDDAYNEWRALQGDPAAVQRRQVLEQQLRSPRGPGGHAAAPARPPAAPAATPLPLPAPLKP